jgi:Tfp pilus assembly protein PilX
MKLKTDRGSVLVAVIMVFAVLSILSITTLSLMASENKQSMYNQNKTQAFYMAKSGADTVEAALISQLATYSGDVDAQKEFLDVYNTPRVISIDVDGVKEVVVKNEVIDGNRILTIQSTSEYRNIEQTVKKALYSVVTEIDSNEQGITISNAPLLYIEEAYQETNKGISDIPPHIASKVDEGVFPPHIFPDVTEEQWDTVSEYVDDGEIINGVVGAPNTTTNIYVNGPLILGGNVTFLGKVNIYVRGNLEILQNTLISSDSEQKSDITEYFFNIHVFNENNETYGLITPLKLHLTFKGNLYVQQGEIDLDLHQDAYIEGSIVYNGHKLNIGTQSNNISNAKKILQGSIYAPNSDIYIGFKNDKTAFILDGMIFGKNLYLYAKNNTQANKFYAAIVTSGTVNVPVNTGSSVKTRTVSYQSYFIE